MVELATSTKSVSASARASSEIFKTWPEYIKAARAEQKRLEEATKGVADMSRAGLRAQEELDRQRRSAYGGAAKIAPVSIGIDFDMGRGRNQLGQFVESINTGLDRVTRV